MAGRFRFRLEVVERLRRQTRDAQRRVVAETLRRVQSVEQRIAELDRNLADTVDQTRGAQRARRLDMASLRGHCIYRGRLHRRILQAHAELGERRRELDAERKTLAETLKRLRAVEKLRERHWERYRERSRREEQAFTDEIALQGFLRARRDSGREIQI